jgi:hypothetical protein
MSAHENPRRWRPFFRRGPDATRKPYPTVRASGRPLRPRVSRAVGHSRKEGRR